MKKIVLSLVLMVLTILTFAQSPESFSYQVIVRDGSSNNPLANQNVSFRMSILKGSSSGISQYSELHSANTGALGIVNLVIGNGTGKTGNITTIDWGADTYFLEVEIDKTGGTGYVEMGTTQLLSVPYAMYAKNVQNKDDADADPVNELNSSIGLSGTTLNVTDAGGTKSVDLVSLRDDADADPINELQQLGINGYTLSITQGNDITIPSAWEITPEGINYNGGRVLINTLTGDKQLELADVFSAGGKNLLVGDDSYLSDVDILNTLGIYGGTDPTLASIKLGSNGPLLSGKDGMLGIGTDQPSALLDLHIFNDFSAPGLNIHMPDVDDQTLNHQALTISSAWNSEGIARANIFSLEDEESSPIMSLRRLGYNHQTILTPGSLIFQGENGNNISMNWEEGFSYGTPTSGYNIIINSEFPLSYRTFSGTWTDRASINSQGNAYFAGNLHVGTGTTSPAAALDVTSTNQGFAMPRMTTVQRRTIVAPIEGLQVYDTDLKGFYYFNGTKWDCSSNPAGTVNYFAGNTPPTGYLECNGQTISRTQYPELFAAVGTIYGAGDGVNTFNVPELRGEFIRSWDNGGRGIDTRTLGSSQSDQLQGHTHLDAGHTHSETAHTHIDTGHTHADAGHTHSYIGIGSVDYTINTTGGPSLPIVHGVVNITGTGSANILSGFANITSSTASIMVGSANLGNPSSSGYETPRIGNDTRPRNVALMACIKY